MAKFEWAMRRNCHLATALSMSLSWRWCFVSTRPSKAVAEMARVVRPGGWVATYMWDILDGGSPTTPIYAAIESLGSTLPVRRPNPAASRLEAMHGFWEMAGLEAIETRVIRIPVRYADFDDFWDSKLYRWAAGQSDCRHVARCARATPRALTRTPACLRMDKSSTSFRKCREGPGTRMTQPRIMSVSD